MDKQTQSIDDAVLFRDYMSPTQHMNITKKYESIEKGPALPPSDDLSRIHSALETLAIHAALKKLALTVPSVENTEQANLQKLYKQASFPSNHT